MLDAYEHQRGHLRQLLKKLPVPRDPSRLPLCRDLQRRPERSAATTLALRRASRWRIARTRAASRTSSSSSTPPSQGRRGARVPVQRRPRSTADHAALARRLRRLLRAWSADDARRWADLPILAGGRARQARLRVERDRSPIPARHARCIACSRRRPQSRPTRIAVLCEDAAVTYGELDARANRLARRLRALGVEARSRWSASALRAIDRHGGGAARHPQGRRRLRAARPGVPEERLAFMVEDARMRGARHRERAGRRACPTARCARPAAGRRRGDAIAARERAPLRAERGDARPERRRPTSSTPRARPASPRACCVPHRAVVNFLDVDARASPGIAASDVVLAVDHAVLRHRGARAASAARGRRRDRARPRARWPCDGALLARADRAARRRP